MKDVFLKSKAVHLKSKAVHLKSKAVHQKSKAVHLKSKADLLNKQADLLKIKADLLNKQADLLKIKADLLNKQAELLIMYKNRHKNTAVFDNFIALHQKYITIMQTTTTAHKEMPHNGELLHLLIEDTNISKASVARELQVHLPALLRYRDTYSLPMGLWWKVSQVLNQNIIGLIAEQLPVEYKCRRERQLEAEHEQNLRQTATLKADYEKRLEKQQAEIDLLRRELETLKFSLNVIASLKK